MVQSPFSTSACIILAGGQSRRMGREKAFLPLPGQEQKTFVENLVALTMALCTEVVLVASDSVQAEKYSELVQVRIVKDQIPGKGPLMGLYSGLSALSAPRALVMAVDMPFVQPELVRYLLSLPDTDSLIVPVVNGIPQVLFAVYPRSALPLIEERLSQGRRDPRSLLGVAPVQYLEEAQLRLIDPELRSFVSVNTPEELQRIL